MISLWEDVAHRLMKIAFAASAWTPNSLPTLQVPDARYQIDLTGQIKLDSEEHCVYCFGSLNYAKIKPGLFFRGDSWSTSRLCRLTSILVPWSGMIAKFEKNFEQFSKECKKKSFLKAMEEVERYKKGTFPGAPGPKPAGVKKEEKDAEKPSKDDKDKTHKKQKVESKMDDSDSSSSRYTLFHTCGNFTSVVSFASIHRCRFATQSRLAMVTHSALVQRPCLACLRLHGSDG